MKDGKLFGKISIVDIVAVILIAAAVWGVYTKFGNPASTIITSSQKIEYTMLVESVRMESVKAFEKGGAVSDGKTREKMGEIINVEYIPATSTKKELADGTFVEAPQPDKYHVYITAALNGKVNDTGFFTQDNKQLNAGSNLIIDTTYARSSAEIIEIREIMD